MAINTKLTWVWMQGQQGATRRAKLSDASGAVDLGQFDTVKVNISLQPRTALLVDVACVADADQSDVSSDTDGKGWLTFTLDATASGLQPGTYYLSFKCMASSVPTYFPLSVDRERTYGKVIVRDPLGA